MAYVRISNFVREYGIETCDLIRELKNKGWTNSQIAAVVHKSPRTGERLTGRRIAQIVKVCFKKEFRPNEILTFYLNNHKSSEDARHKWEMEKVDELLNAERKHHSGGLRLVSE